MFPVKTYVSRRAELRAKTGGGLILLPGNQPSANNYPNNAYYFRQDSTFLYYFGLDRPSLAGVIDADTGEEVLFGDDFTVDDIINRSRRRNVLRSTVQSGRLLYQISTWSQSQH